MAAREADRGERRAGRLDLAQVNADALSNPAAEWAVVASLLTDPSRIAEVVGGQLEAEDFLREDHRLLYATTVESYYADATIEPLVIGEKLKLPLSRLWETNPASVPGVVLERVGRRDLSGHVMDHAAILRRLSTARRLFNVAQSATVALIEGEATPEQVASTMSTEALAVSGGTVKRSELLTWMDAGREFARYLQRQKIARERGIDLAVYTSYPFIDRYTRGLAPTELCFLAGAPGSGKSIVAWLCAEGFAVRQMAKLADERIGTLVVSMEMGNIPSSTRLAQSITNLDGMRLREGEITESEYKTVLREWKARDGLPIYFNYASNFKLSQLRALIVEAIRRYNVGFVVLDHFRQIDPDRYISNPNDADEVKVRFLKESIAKDLNVAVLCLGHTIKVGRASEGPGVRPRLSDLRGSGQIAAAADFVGLLYRPSRNLSEGEQQELGVQENDAEMLWVKGRHTHEGTAYFTIDPVTMSAGTR